MNTIEVCEHLLYKIPNLRESFYALSIIDDNRNIAPIEHKEFENILNYFNNPKIISIFSLVQITLLIEPIKINRKIPVLLINGIFCSRNLFSKTYIHNLILKYLNIKDFLPASLVKKIIYIKDFNTMDGIIFSEYLKSIWTIDDPLQLPVKNYLKTNPKIIVDKILDDIISQI